MMEEFLVYQAKISYILQFPEIQTDEAQLSPTTDSNRRGPLSTNGTDSTVLVTLLQQSFNGFPIL